MSHFNVSLIVWAKSPDSVHKPPFLKRKESRRGSNRGPSAYQPSALPLGHTGSHTSSPLPRTFKYTRHICPALEGKGSPQGRIHSTGEMPEMQLCLFAYRSCSQWLDGDGSLPCPFPHQLLLYVSVRNAADMRPNLNLERDKGERQR